MSSTQAYSVEVPTHSVPQLIAIIKEVTKDTKEYFPFQMRTKNPEAFQGAIRYQNHMIAHQHVVMIHHLGTDAMYYWSDRIKAIQGVQDVLPTKKQVSQNGKFYVLVNKNDENRVRKSLQKRFDGWYREVVPDDAKPKEGQFGSPPEVPTPRTDGYSSGDNSWMTTSTKSFMEYSVESMTSTTSNVDTSYLDNAWDNRNETSTPSMHQSSLPRSLEKTYASYAAATVSDQVSGITESDTPRDLRHEELTNKIVTLEAMIVQLCQQVQALTNSPAQSQQMTGVTESEGSTIHREKRLDRKDSPRKHKQRQQTLAPSGIEEDNTEPAPMGEDRLTVWDDAAHDQDDDL